jgi:ATP-binding cassette subfamily C protein LapB
MSRNSNIPPVSLWGFLKDSYREIPYLVLANTGINILGLAMPLFVMQVYDRIIPSHAGSTLLWLAVGAVVAVTCETLLRYARDGINLWAASCYEFKLIHRAYESFLTANIARFSRDDTTVHLDRIQAIQNLKNGYFLQIFEVVLELPMVALYTWLLFLLNEDIARFMLAINLGMLVITALNKVFYERYRARQDDSQNRRMSWALEIFSRMHLIKAMAIEEPLLARYEAIQHEHNQNNFGFGMVNHLSNIFHTIMPQVTQFGVIAIGAVSVYQGEMSIGLMIACMLIGSRSIGPVIHICTFWLKNSEFALARQKVQEIYNLYNSEAAEQADAPDRIAGHVRMINVSFQYEGAQQPVFENLNLTIGAGSMVGIKGAGSRGTTTLLRLISGWLKPHEGRIYLDDFDLAAVNPSSLFGTVEFLSEQHKLLTGNILDNLSGFDQTLHAASIEASSMLRLDSRIAKLDQGYTSAVESTSNRTFPLSLLKSVAFIKALAARPRILLIDHFDRSLDIETSILFLDTLKQIKGLCTLVVVSDHEDVLNLMDSVYTIENGGLRKLEKDPSTSDSNQKPRAA